MTAWHSYALDGATLLFDRSSGTNIRIQNEFTRGQQRAAPRVVMFAITNRCNLTCSFCSRDTETPSQWTVDSAYNMLAGLAALGTLEVAFGGGEPLAFRGFDELALRLANETPLALHVTTNGVLLTPKPMTATFLPVYLIKKTTLSLYFFHYSFAAEKKDPARSFLLVPRAHHCPLTTPQYTALTTSACGLPPVPHIEPITCRPYTKPRLGPAPNPSAPGCALAGLPAGQQSPPKFYRLAGAPGNRGLGRRPWACLARGEGKPGQAAGGGAVASGTWRSRKPRTRFSFPPSLSSPAGFLGAGFPEPPPASSTARTEQRSHATLITPRLPAIRQIAIVTHPLATRNPSLLEPYLSIPRQLPMIQGSFFQGPRHFRT